MCGVLCARVGCVVFKSMGFLFVVVIVCLWSCCCVCRSVLVVFCVDLPVS